MRSPVLFLMLCLAAGTVFAESGSWVGIHPTVDLGKDRRLELQAEYRNQGGSDQTLIRPYLSYPISSKLRGGSGFDLFSAPEFESRIWQEFVLNGKVGAGMSHLRLRQEVRSRSGGGRVAFRTRLMGDWAVPLLQSPQIKWVAFDELFIAESDYDTGFVGMDRNWLGARFVVGAPGGALSLGAMWEHVTHPTPLDNLIVLISYGLTI